MAKKNNKSDSPSPEPEPVPPVEPTPEPESEPESCVEGEQSAGEPAPPVEDLPVDVEGGAEVEAPAVVDPLPTILVEGGGRVEVFPGQHRQWRVRSTAGTYYDHCSDAPDGEWIYRESR